MISLFNVCTMSSYRFVSPNLCSSLAEQVLLGDGKGEAVPGCVGRTQSRI